jgi:hypothetical protein
MGGSKSQQRVECSVTAINDQRADTETFSKMARILSYHFRLATEIYRNWNEGNDCSSSF